MPKFYLFSRLHHNCCDPDNNYWTAAGGRLPKTGHYSIVGCPGHVRYFSGLTWNFPLPQFIYVVNQSFPSPPHISSKVYTGLSCPVLLLSTISISQVPREEFDDVLAQRPQLLVCSVEFLQNTDVGLLASQSDAHRIDPHRDPNPSIPIQSTYSSKARKTHDVIYF